jgi:hypothetical protein
VLTTLFLRSSGHCNTDAAIRTGVLVRRLRYISVFQQKDADHYELLAKVSSSLGARTSGYAGKVGKKGFERLYVAVPARTNRGAEIRIYTVQD